MSAGRDQVALLTRGLRLPQPPIHPVHLAIILDAICQAWECITGDWPGTASGEPERVVNAALVTHLKRALGTKTPFSTLVSSVDRGIEQHSFDGSKFESRPDLNFYLTGRDRQFPFVGECKIIDLSNGKDLKKYRENGIERFEKGDYGWANSEGIMVAYVRDASEAGTALASVIGSTLVPFTALSRMHHRSPHPRLFDYVDRDPDIERPGDVSIVHVWLSSRHLAAAPSQPT